MLTTAQIWAQQFVIFVPRLLTAALIFAVFWFAANVVRNIIRSPRISGRLNPDVSSLLSSAARIAILSFGAVTALGNLGIDVTALVAGLGLVGFAIGVAFRDAVSNLLSGILILTYEPFRRGDRVNVAGSEGRVTEINLRYTELVSDAGDKILVPNAKAFENVVTVFKGGPTPVP